MPRRLELTLGEEAEGLALVALFILALSLLLFASIAMACCLISTGLDKVARTLLTLLDRFVPRHPLFVRYHMWSTKMWERLDQLDTKEKYRV